MINLLPTELHRYSLVDVAHGLVAMKNSNPGRAQIVLPGLGECAPIRSARAAIVLSLKALGLREGSRVGVPLYCCPVVFKAIQMAFCRPVFLDVDPATFCVSLDDLNAKSEDLDAVIPVHMFGNVCDMEGVLKVMRGKPVLEDCAQALGSRINGQWVGSMGTVAVFSFRLGKYISAGEGAAIYAEEVGLRREIERLAVDTEEPSFAEEIVHVLESYLRSKLRSNPLWGLAGSSVWRIYNKRTDFADKSPIRVQRIFKSDLAIARRRMTSLGELIEAQRENADYYAEHLKPGAFMFCHEKPGTLYNRFMFPLIFDTIEQRVFMRDALKRLGVDSATPYEEVSEGAAKHYGYRGDCPVAEKLLKTTVVIPSHYRLTKREIDRIVRSFNSALDGMTTLGSRTRP
jgi:perosamine synthetase